MDEGARRGHEQAIVEQVRQTPGEWNEIRIHVCANVGSTGVTPRADMPGPVFLPVFVAAEIDQLREAMVDPERGAWLMSDITVPRTGEASFAYDWMARPDWPSLGGEFDDALYLDDLKRYPRTPENIPDWYPRQG
jgi:hypothetical protein